MSSPSGLPIPELIARFLALHVGKNGSEVARLVGVDQSSISKWRRGILPTQLQEVTRKKLAAAVGAELPRDDGTLLAFAAGVLWGIERDARHIAETASAARQRLGYDDLSITPTAGEVVVGMQALDAVEAESPGHPPRRRKGQSRPA